MSEREDETSNAYAMPARASGFLKESSPREVALLLGAIAVVAIAIIWSVNAGNTANRLEHAAFHLRYDLADIKSDIKNCEAALK